MNIIINALDSLHDFLAARDFKQLAVIVEAALSMTGRVTVNGQLI